MKKHSSDPAIGDLYLDWQGRYALVLEVMSDRTSFPVRCLIAHIFSHELGKMNYAVEELVERVG